ncbi:MAG TPA: WYL domain-containing transcriptional regulator [Pseudobacteroides sp.]|uniref:helix-turn-helix transcriptional regulator n=1 Tax=Pseudobacteroides sp. TaxID=1968840 RepID=UPI002F957B4E
MSQIGNALSMYFLLRSRGKMKTKELADILEIDKRTISRFRDELEIAGIYIDSFTGKHGGYKLSNKNIISECYISDQEYNSLLLIEKYLKDSKHIANKDITSLTEKINCVKKTGGISYDEFYNHLNKVTLSNVDHSVERKKLLDIHSASLCKNKLLIKYNSLSSGLTVRIVRPYATFEYKGDMYFAGFCEKKNTILDFKMCRITEYELLEERFEEDKNFDMKSFMSNCIGIYKGKEYRIKLKIKKPISQIIKEKIWVENQVVTDLDNGAVLFQAKMRGLEEIKTWILGMGSAVTVLEPEEIKVDIRNEIKKMTKIYL